MGDSGRKIITVSLMILFRQDRYFGVFRGSHFAHDSWKQEMAEDEIITIEKDCEDFMKMMEYKKFEKDLGIISL